MEEIKKQISIKDLKVNKGYKKLFYWSVRRLPIMRLFYLAIIFVIMLSFYGMFLTYKEVETSTAFMYINFIVPPVLTVFVVLFCVPFFIYKLDISRAAKFYGNSYEVITSEEGILAKDRNILWNSSVKIISGKYGIALISTSKIIILFPIHNFSEEEYQKIKSWIKV